MPIKRILHLAFSLALGVSCALTVFAWFLQPLGGAWLRVTALLILLSALFGLGADGLLRRYVYPALRGVPWLAGAGWILLCLLVGQVLIASVNLRAEDIHFLFPRHRLEVTATGRHNPASAGGAVGIRYLADGDVYQFDLNGFQHSAAWTIDNGVLQTDLVEPSAALWDGSLLNRGRLALKSGPAAGIARVVWDGQAQDVDLYSPGEQLTILKLEVSNPPAKPFRWAALAAYGLSFAFLLLGLTAFWRRLPPGSQPEGRARLGFLWLALPMLAAWGTTLLVFFPGILSSDSTDQWSMILGVKPLTDWHPAAHTLLWGLVTRVWHTPAAMALLQIVALSLVAAWGIRFLIDLGLPTWAGWTLSFLFSLSPVNASMTITMWKDISYGISLFALFLLSARVVLSDGEWAAKPGRWVWLGLAGAATGLFRHNGAAVAGVILLALLVAYRRYWRALIQSVGLALVIWALVSGPVYALAKVERVSDILGDTILLHHFGAHVNAGTPLTDEERTYFNSLAPLDQWKYYCCNVTPLYFDTAFNQSMFEANRDKHLRIFLDLLLRDPMVDIRHTLCSSGLVWKMCNDCSFLGAFILPAGDSYHWIEPNDLGVQEASLLPGLVTPLARWVTASSLPPWFALAWSPAFYLLLGSLAVLLYAVWQRRWKILLIGLPLWVQSAVLFLINISNDFRYQYGVYLIGLYSAGLLIICLVRRGRKPSR